MKIILISAALLSSMAFSQEAPAPPQRDFRAVTWGMVKEDVKAAEKDGVFYADADGKLAYNVSLGDRKALLGYIFNDGKLIRAKYIFLDPHANKNDFTIDFSSVDQILTEKYGKPDSNQPIWKDSLYKNDPEHVGMAIATGRLVLVSRWKTPRTSVIHMLNGDNFKISHTVEYDGPDWDSDAPKKKSLKDY
jgi:hypothetical protein